MEIKGGGGVSAGPGPKDSSTGSGQNAKAPLTDAEILDAVAGRIVRMGLTTPAIFFLESSKPLSYVGSQGLVFLEPFIKAVLNLAYYDRFVALMEDRVNFERLIGRIEDLDETEQSAERERKRVAKAERAAAGPSAAGGGPSSPEGPGLNSGPIPKGWRRVFARRPFRRD